jgi:hypothetical protein
VLRRRAACSNISTHYTIELSSRRNIRRFGLWRIHYSKVFNYAPASPSLGEGKTIFCCCVVNPIHFKWTEVHFKWTEMAKFDLNL